MHGGGGLGGRLGSSLGVDLSSLGGIRGGTGSSGGFGNSSGGFGGGGISSDQIQFDKNVNERIETHGDSNQYNDNDSSSDDNNNKLGKSRNNRFNRKDSKKSKSKKKKSGQRGFGFKLGSMSKEQDKLFEEQNKADSTLIQTKILNSSLLSGNAGVSTSHPSLYISPHPFNTSDKSQIFL